MTPTVTRCDQCRNWYHHQWLYEVDDPDQPDRHLEYCAHCLGIQEDK